MVRTLVFDPSIPTTSRALKKQVSMNRTETIAYVVIFLLVIFTVTYLMFIVARLQCPECTLAEKMGIVIDNIKGYFTIPY